MVSIMFSVVAQRQGSNDMNRVLALTMVCGLMSGCVSTGVDVRPEQLEDFLPGFSTQEDVIGQIGVPTSQATLSNGSTILIYSFATSQTHPESFIPIVGPLFAGGKIRSSTALFEFDSNGVLRSVRRATSSGASGLSVLPP